MLIFLLTCVSGASLLLFVLLISLYYMFVGDFISGLSVENARPFKLLARLTEHHVPVERAESLCAGCVCLLFVFLFIPMGTLPRFLATNADIFIIFTLLLAAQGFYLRGIKKYSKELYASLGYNDTNLLFKFTVALLVIGVTFSWYILNRGLPGGLFSLDSYAAISLWGVTGWFGRLGLGLFIVLLLVTSPCKSARIAYGEEDATLPMIFDALRSSICPAIIAAVFAPHKAGILLGLTGVAMFTVDFASFWFEVFILQIFVIPVFKRGYAKIRAKLPDKLKLIIVIFLAMAGVALMMCDLYLYE